MLFRSISYLWHEAEDQGKVAALNALGTQSSYDHLPHRLKCEVFGRYFFSINKPRNALNYQIGEYEDNKFYRCFYFNEDNTVQSIVMVDDKDRAKLYEQAVQESWPREKVEDTFLGTPSIG